MPELCPSFKETGLFEIVCKFDNNNNNNIPLGLVICKLLTSNFSY